MPASRAEVRVEVEGLVEAVFVREGEEVRTGQPIARVSARVHNKKPAGDPGAPEKDPGGAQPPRSGTQAEVVEAALADVQTAAVQSGWSSVKAERVARMYTDSLVAQRDYENALGSAMSTRSDLTRRSRPGAGGERRAAGAHPCQEGGDGGSQVLVDDYQADVDDTTLSSPIDGRVVTPRSRSSSAPTCSRGSVT